MGGRVAHKGGGREVRASLLRGGQAYFNRMCPTKPTLAGCTAPPESGQLHSTVNYLHM